VQVAHAGIPLQGPQQRVFTGAGADHENAHVGQSIGP
jgi:hypothetical protein